MAGVGVMFTPNFTKIGWKFQIFSGVAQKSGILLTTPRKDGSLTVVQNTNTSWIHLFSLQSRVAYAV
jgi:hypothetical protein